VKLLYRQRGTQLWSDQGLTNVLQNLGSIKTVIYDCFYNEMTTSNIIIKPRDYSIITHLQWSSSHCRKQHTWKPVIHCWVCQHWHKADENSSIGNFVQIEKKNFLWPVPLWTHSSSTRKLANVVWLWKQCILHRSESMMFPHGSSWYSY
jgi:hypothetical protein